MAKKKATQQKEKPAHNQEEVEVGGAVGGAAMEDASEKLESLKSLNAMLLKETKERRQQVDSLMEEKGSLESELTRSKSERDSLQAELARLSEKSVQMELERSLAFVFVAVQVGQHAEVIERERDLFGREKVEIEKKLKGLERDMGQVLREKNEIEKVKREKEDEIELFVEKMRHLSDEIGNEKNVSRGICKERDLLRSELDVQLEEAVKLKEELIKLGERESKIQEEFGKVTVQYNNMVEEKEERERRMESVMEEKDSLERNLAESNKEIDEMKREIELFLVEKKRIEEERNAEILKNCDLENAVSGLNETVSSLRKEEENLFANLAELEKKFMEGLEKQKDMARDIDELVATKSEGEKRLERLLGEKSLLEKDLAEALQQLEAGKQRFECLANERSEMEAAKIRGESEIVELQKQVTEFRNALSQLEESSLGHMERIKHLESEVLHHKNALEQVTSERDVVAQNFEEEKQTGISLKERIQETEILIEEKLKVIEVTMAEYGKVVEEKKGLESKYDMLSKEVTSLESALAEARKEFTSMQGKLEVADANSERVFNLLRRTSELVCSKDEKNDVDGCDLHDRQMNGEAVKSYVAEFELIKNAFKSRERKVEDMKRQVEFLQNSAAEAHKRKNFWTILSSATTIFAAISVAYAARGH